MRKIKEQRRDTVLAEMEVLTERITAQCAVLRAYLENNRSRSDLFDPLLNTWTVEARKAYAETIIFRIVCLHFLDARGCIAVRSNRVSDQKSVAKHALHLKKLFQQASTEGKQFVVEVLNPLWSVIVNKKGGILTYDANLRGFRHLRVFSLGHDPLGESSTDPQTANFPTMLFEPLFEALSGYRFVWDESVSSKTKHIVTPEIFSMLYESSLETNSESGAYYTPKAIAAYMVKESLKAYLTSQIASTSAQKAIQAFVETHDSAVFTTSEVGGNTVFEWIKNVRICDPAVGAGAFPLELLGELSACLTALDQSKSSFEVKKYLVEHCLWGVDIDSRALSITRLRVWFALMTSMHVPLYVADVEKHFVAGNALGASLLPDLAAQVGGFHIVIGNPPYGVKMSEDEKKAYKKRFAWLERRFDIYMAFYAMGYALTQNILCYITPDKWLSKSFALKFREQCMIPHMRRVLHLRNTVFKTARVDAMVALFEKTENRQLDFLAYEQSEQRLVQTIDKNQLEPPYLIDQYFREPSSIIKTLEAQPCKLSDFAKCDYACVSPVDAYKLKDLIRCCARPKQSDLILVNTGLIGKYISLWKQKPMRYLKSSFAHPVVSIEALQEAFGKAYVQRMQQPKLIIKGLNLLDCTIDTEGRMMSTVATLNVRASSVEHLFILGAIVNSSIVRAYCKAKYMSSSYCGGLEFTPSMISQLPVPDLSDLNQGVLASILKTVQSTLLKRNEASLDRNIERIDALVSRLYSISVERD